MRYQTATISRWLRRAILRRLGGKHWELSRPSGLFYPVCLAIASGLVAAFAADPEAPGFALNSVWLYRAEVGLAFMGAIYIVGMILWLAWHGRGFFELGAFGLTLKASDAEEIKTAESGLTGSEEKILKFQMVAIDGLEELDARLSTLEDRAGLRTNSESTSPG